MAQRDCALDTGKIKNGVLRRNTTGCHAQRLVTCSYLVDMAS
jgi:hypothetical protein